MMPQREGSVTGVGTMDSQATSLYNLLVCLWGLLSPSRLQTLPVWVEYGSARPALGAADTQITWGRGGPRLSTQSLPRPGSRPRTVSQKDSSYLQRVTVLCPQILRACTAIYL